MFTPPSAICYEHEKNCGQPHYYHRIQATGSILGRVNKKVIY